MKRRDFLKLLPLIPLYKVVWPQIAQTAVNPQASSDQPNILVLVFDTLSARHVSLYGYERETTPNMARLAEKATVFHNHHSTANFTSPATSSMLTGTYPWTHRAFHLHSLVRDEFVEHNIFKQLPSSYHRVAYTHNLLVMSLLHQFRADIEQFKLTRDLCIADTQMADQLFFNDYTPAFLGEWQYMRGSSAPPTSLFLSTADRGRRFWDKRRVEQEYGDLFPKGVPNLHSLYFVLEDAINWISEQVSSWPRPYFGYFHLLPPHEPYTTRKDFVDIFKDGWEPTVKPKTVGDEGFDQDYLNWQRREYDEYFAYTDAELGRLLDSLEQSGEFDNTYIVLTSDHGELFERGIRGHVTPTLYEPLLHVPLLIHAPKQTTRQDVFENTSAVDLLPTFLQWTGQPVPNWAEGRPLPVTTNIASRTGDEETFGMEAKSNPKLAPLQNATLSMTQDGFKLIHYLDPEGGNGRYELYYLPDDPQELVDIYDSNSSVASLLQEKLQDQLATVNQPYAQ